MKLPQVTTLVFFVVCFACLIANPASGQTTLISPTQFRAERDAEFRDPETSPLETWEVPRFKGLKYFEIDPRLRLQASFVRTANEKKFNMPTSSGMTKVYVKYGELTFKLRNRVHKLSVYQSEALAQTENTKPTSDSLH